MTAEGSLHPREHRAKELMRHGQLVAGLMISTPTPMLVDLAAAAGFGLVMADGEHGEIAPEHVPALARAAALAEIGLIVRSPGLDVGFLSRCLDGGAHGVVVPHVNTTGEARCLVRTGRYWPVGSRGLGSSWANRYGLAGDKADYVRRANDQTLLIAQVEDIAALEELDELVQVPGLDGILVGTNDLALSMGRPGQADAREVQAVVERIVSATRGAHKLLGLPAETAGELQGAREHGAHFTIASLGDLVVQAGARYLAPLRS